MKELQSLALDVKVLTENGEELIIRELDDEDDAIPTAHVREAEEREAAIPDEEFELGGSNTIDEDEGDLDGFQLFDTDDDDDFSSKELFSDEDVDDFGDDDDLGDKYTLFDADDDDDDDKDDLSDDDKGDEE